MELTGAKILMECLVEQKAETVFGYPGGTILNVYDALYDYQDRIHHYLTSHEQGASHAADGYFRSTGRTGVCFATSGPGATNLTTGIATAYYDSSAVVFISCNVTEPMLGKDAFQEVDLTGIAMPITKACYLVDDVTKLADVVREAFYLASHGRPGPVLIDILKNVTAETAEYTPLPLQEHPNHGHLAQVIARSSTGFKSIDTKPECLEKAAEMVAGAKRPVILAGGGVIRSGASAEVKSLAERLDAVVTASIMGLGGFPGNDPRFAGFAGMHGSHAANQAIYQCDLLFVIGCRFSDRVALSPSHFAPNARIIHLDIDRAEINKNVHVDRPLIGDAKDVLQKLLPQITQQSHPDWRAQIAAEVREPVKQASTLEPFEIMQTIESVTGGQALIVTDVGQHQMWASQYFRYRYPCQLLTSGGFGTMGFGYGAAMGAKVGNPDKTVIHVTGDGCFRMNCNEMATAQHYGIPVITVLFDNGTLGMVRQWQRAMYDCRFSATTLDRGPDFVKLAEAYGIHGVRVATAAEFETALRQAIASGEAAVIDCAIDIDETVRPMIAGGHALNDYLLD
ncbi:MAG: biosynthetic-type acetolactate synthase large subunit [Oscillospiraceae bacterium]|nr:biosynthetic-type acetolactate synthase large subunit [Oscillospiraceae bacterium]